VYGKAPIYLRGLFILKKEKSRPYGRTKKIIRIYEILPPDEILPYKYEKENGLFVWTKMKELLHQSRDYLLKLLLRMFLVVRPKHAGLKSILINNHVKIKANTLKGLMPQYTGEPRAYIPNLSLNISPFERLEEI
jgi:hypothetical protein